MELRVGLKCKHRINGLVCTITNIDLSRDLVTIIWPNSFDYSYPYQIIRNYYNDNNIIQSDWKISFRPKQRKTT